MTVPILTAVLAIFVFVLTQSFLKFVLEPILEQRKLVGEVAHALVFYANAYHVKDWGAPDEREVEDLEEARKTLRGLSGRLQASLWTIPFYDSLAWLWRVPEKEDVIEASTQLVGWSNTLYSGRDEDREKRRKIIADRLGISKRLTI